MKIIEKNGKIFLQANFKNLTDSENKFMRDLAYKGILWGKFDEDGDAPLIERESATPLSINIRNEIIDQETVGVAEISDSVKAIFQAQKETAKKWHEDQTKEYIRRKNLEKEIERSYAVRERGCQGCYHLRLENGKYMCKYTDKPCYKKADEAELEFYAQREARIIRAQNWYWARPFPMPGCEVIMNGMQAEIELQEIKEKEGK